jgi:hypothetical protein
MANRIARGIHRARGIEKCSVTPKTPMGRLLPILLLAGVLHSAGPAWAQSDRAPQSYGVLERFGHPGGYRFGPGNFALLPPQLVLSAPFTAMRRPATTQAEPAGWSLVDRGLSPVVHPISLLLRPRVTKGIVRDPDDGDGESRRKSVIGGVSISHPLPIPGVAPIALKVGVRVDLKIVRPELEELYGTRFPFAAALFLRFSTSQI